MTSAWQDLRFALRMTARRPGLTLAVVLTLAVGIGANIAVFGVVNALLFRGPQVRERDSLAWIFSRTPGDPYGTTAFSDFRDFLERNTTLDAIVAEGARPVSLSSREGARQVWALMVSENYFSVLGLKASAGRMFEPKDLAGDGPALPVVLSSRLWRSRFDSSPDVLGKTILLNRVNYVVIGIAPEKMRSLCSIFTPDLWIPLEAQKLEGTQKLRDRAEPWLGLIGKLRPGIGVKQAEAELSGIARQLEIAYPETNRDRGVHLAAMSEGHPEGRRSLRTGALLLMSVVSLVLLIACFNASSLILARALERQRETGIRMALGAGRFRLYRLFVVEGLVLAALGGLLGLLPGSWVAGILPSFMPPAPIPQEIDTSIDLRVLCFGLLLSVISGALPGLFAAWNSTRADPMKALRNEGASAPGIAGRLDLKDLLIVAQVAVSFILLVGAGLLGRSWINYAGTNPGFDTAHTAVLSIQPGLYGYDGSQAWALYQEVLKGVLGVPGVRAATLTDRAPLSMGGNMERLWTGSGACPEEGCLVPSFRAGPDYFETLRIPILLSRGGGSSALWPGRDGVFINETLARRLWPGTSPIGAQLLLGADRRQMTVLGVTADVKWRTLSESPQPILFLPVDPADPAPGMVLVVRTDGSPAQLIPRLRELVLKLDRNLPIQALQTMQEHLRLAYWAPRTAVVFFSTSAVLALFLTVVGLYAVIHRSIRRRVREVAIRSAIGAGRTANIRLLVTRGMILTAVGLAVGCAGALAATRILAGALFGVAAADPLTYGGVCLMMGFVAFSACLVPAWRATRLDPMEALREE